MISEKRMLKAKLSERVGLTSYQLEIPPFKLFWMFPLSSKKRYLAIKTNGNWDVIFNGLSYSVTEKVNLHLESLIIKLNYPGL